MTFLLDSSRASTTTSLVVISRRTNCLDSLELVAVPLLISQEPQTNSHPKAMAATHNPWVALCHPPCHQPWLPARATASLCRATDSSRCRATVSSRCRANSHHLRATDNPCKVGTCLLLSSQASSHPTLTVDSLQPSEHNHQRPHNTRFSDGETQALQKDQKITIVPQNLIEKKCHETTFPLMSNSLTHILMKLTSQIRLSFLLISNKSS